MACRCGRLSCTRKYRVPLLADDGATRLQLASFAWGCGNRSKRDGARCRAGVMCTKLGAHRAAHPPRWVCLLLLRMRAHRRTIAIRAAGVVSLPRQCHREPERPGRLLHHHCPAGRYIIYTFCLRGIGQASCQQIHSMKFQRRSKIGTRCAVQRPARKAATARPAVPTNTRAGL